MGIKLAQLLNKGHSNKHGGQLQRGGQLEAVGQMIQFQSASGQEPEQRLVLRPSTGVSF